MKIIWLFFLWIKEAFKGFFRNLTWNLAALALTIFCLLGFAGSYIMGKTADNIAEDLGDKVEIQVNLKEDIAQTEHENIGIQLGAISNVNNVLYESKDQIYDKMKEEMGKDSDILEILDENPFSARFILSLEDPNQIDEVISKVEAMNVSDNIQYGEGYVKRLLEIMAAITKFGYIFTVVIAIATIYIVSTVIKFNIDQRKNEVRIKQLTGSGYFTIRMPFFIEALLITVMAGLIVCGIVLMGYEPSITKLHETVPYANFMNVDTAINKIVVWVGILSAGIALIGTILSTSKNLNKI